MTTKSPHQCLNLDNKRLNVILGYTLETMVISNFFHIAGNRKIDPWKSFTFMNEYLKKKINSDLKSNKVQV